MSDTPIYDQIRAETLLDPIPAMTTVRASVAAEFKRALAAHGVVLPPHLTGPCEDRPPRELTDHDGIE